MLAFIGLIAALAPVIAGFDPIGIDPARALYSPGLPYLFGSDQYGRDVFSRVVFGSRVSLAVGLLAGYYGRWLDVLLMRIVDVMLAFPGILLALGIVPVLGPSLSSLMVAVGIFVHSHLCAPDTRIGPGRT
jgi:peptide/nickel transport system permease protein